MRKPISTIIPTYNGLKLLQENLPAVLAELKKGDQLIIVDDAGSDDSPEWLKENFAKKTDVKGVELKIIINKKNLRFGESVNKGVLAANHDLIFLLNNDVSPHKNCVEALVKHFEKENSKQDLFGVGCLEKEIKNGKTQYHGKNKLWFKRGLFIHSKAEEMKSGPTAWVIGGSGMFDKKKWLELGGFDHLFYPAYWEDIDLSFQARKKGWRILFEEKAVVDHNHESTNKDAFGDKKLKAMSWNNSLKFTFKNGDLWQRIAFFLWQPYWILKRLYA
jgi:O-antigen biosynthesis protein